MWFCPNQMFDFSVGETVGEALPGPNMEHYSRQKARTKMSVVVTASVLALVPLNLLAAAFIVALWLCLSLGLCVHCEVSHGLHERLSACGRWAPRCCTDTGPLCTWRTWFPLLITAARNKVTTASTLVSYPAVLSL